MQGVGNAFVDVLDPASLSPVWSAPSQPQDASRLIVVDTSVAGDILIGGGTVGFVRLKADGSERSRPMGFGYAYNLAAQSDGSGFGAATPTGTATTPNTFVYCE
jgi:hypothetical protein